MELIVLGILLALLLVFWCMAQISKQGRAIGLVDGQLARCIDKPNCICTEYEDDEAHYYEPLSFQHLPIEPEVLRSLVSEVIHEAGGVVQIQSNSYLSAIFESRILGFVDDFEVRIDKQNSMIFLRSASRVGYSDFGANLNRVAEVSRLLNNRIAKG